MAQQHASPRMVRSPAQFSPSRQQSVSSQQGAYYSPQRRSVMMDQSQVIYSPQRPVYSEQQQMFSTGKKMNCKKKIKIFKTLQKVLNQIKILIKKI